jgi:hypothetical protein
MPASQWERETVLTMWRHTPEFAQFVWTVVQGFAKWENPLLEAEKLFTHNLMVKLPRVRRKTILSIIRI